VGVGDPYGMAITHAIASGLGGMRGAGDLVARMQMSRGMRIDEAKAYVASKLKIGVMDLTDPVIMTELRQELGLGTVTLPGGVKGIEAKFRMAEFWALTSTASNGFNTTPLSEERS
jgi:dimethylamine--corrinoid protein Co-methyltransferase